MRRWLLLVLAAVAPAWAESLLILGDSITAGLGVEPASAWPQLLQRHLSASAATARWRVIDAGVSGDTTAGGLARLPRLLAQHRPRAVLLALGGNDGLRGVPPARVEANLVRMAELARAASAAVLIAGMQQPVEMRQTREAFARVFPTVAQRFSAPLYPFLLHGVAMDPALNLPDRIHPNPAGHRILAEGIHAWLAPILSSP